ncbi:MAG: hypothetical protein PUP93_33890 [Rhizonema sp. NSF051]|nr:hypothetical protein [Rhizonema sp. NSF051]
MAATTTLAKLPKPLVATNPISKPNFAPMPLSYINQKQSVQSSRICHANFTLAREKLLGRSLLRLPQPLSQKFKN